MDADLFSDEDLAWFERLYDFVLEGNRRMNLTRITGREEFFSKHILDSALPFAVVPELAGLRPSLHVADLGSGAGFPGLVLARLHPGWKVALIERTLKKAAYLERACAALGLRNASVVARDAREARIARRDLVVARAVGRLADVTRAAAGLLAKSGLLVHYKGGALSGEELEEGRAAAERLGLAQGEPFGYTLPPGGDRRALVVVKRARGRGQSSQRSKA